MPVATCSRSEMLIVALSLSALLLSSCASSPVDEPTVTRAQQPTTEPTLAPQPTSEPTGQPIPVPEPTLVPEPTAESTPVREPTLVPEPTAEPPVAAEQPEPTGLTVPILVSDGVSLRRVHPDGRSERVYSSRGWIQIEDFASDGAGGVVFQQDDQSKENEFIGWIPARPGGEEVVLGEPDNGVQFVEWPVVAEGRAREGELRLDIVGVLGAAPTSPAQILYQRVDSCCGALESMGTLRTRSFDGRVDRAIRSTLAWEGSSDFATPTGATIGVVQGAHEWQQLLEVDSATGQTVFEMEWTASCFEESETPIVCQSNLQLAAPRDQGLVTVSLDRYEDRSELVIGTVDREIRGSVVVAAVPVASDVQVTDLFIDGESAVISLTGPAPDAASLPPLIVDLSSGETRELAFAGEVRADVIATASDRADTAPMAVVPLSLADASLGDFGDSRDEVVALLGEPVEEEEFEWGGGLTGYVLRYDNLVIQIHYGVSYVTVSGPDACTQAGVCVGDGTTSLERAYGIGLVHTEFAEPAEGERPNHDTSVTIAVAGAGYCSLSFTLTHGIRIDSITAGCLPD